MKKLWTKKITLFWNLLIGLQSSLFLPKAPCVSQVPPQCQKETNEQVANFIKWLCHVRTSKTTGLSAICVNSWPVKITTSTQNNTDRNDFNCSSKDSTEAINKRFSSREDNTDWFVLSSYTQKFPFWKHQLSCKCDRIHSLKFPTARPKHKSPPSQEGL